MLPGVDAAGLATRYVYSGYHTDVSFRLDRGTGGRAGAGDSLLLRRKKC